MSGHTKGPWFLKDAGYIHTSVDGYEYDGFVALMRATCANGRWEADARLIAAAPDLLAACKAALDHITGPLGPIGEHRENPIPTMLREAIAKAEDK